ncbi:hypothetical protein ACFE04_029873 [Oxalis oulophora]
MDRECEPGECENEISRSRSLTTIHWSTTCTTMKKSKDNQEEPPLQCKLIVLTNKKVHNIYTNNLTVTSETYNTFVCDIRLLPDGELHGTAKFSSNLKSNHTAYRASFNSLPRYYRSGLISHEIDDKPENNYFEDVISTRLLMLEINEDPRSDRVIFVDEVMNTFPDNVVNKELANKEDLCSICLGQFEENNVDDPELIKTPCSHCFHGQCILPWFRANDSCPICRHTFAISFSTL